MAETTIFSWNYRGAFSMCITCETTAQSINDITSTVLVRLKSKGSSSSYRHDLDASITTGSVNKIYRNAYGDLSLAVNSSSWVTRASWYVTVQHDNLGVGSMSFSIVNPPSMAYSSKWGVACGTSSGTYFQSHSDVYGSYTPPAIPRQSSYSNIPTSITTGEAMSIAVSRNVSTYWHKVSFIYNGTTLATTDAFETNGSYTVPHTWMQQLVTSTSLSVTARLKTYSEQACTNQIGNDVDATVTVNAAASIAPTISSAVLSPVTAQSVTGYVQGYSKASAAITASNSACQGASITEYKLVIAGQTVTGASGSLVTANVLSVSGDEVPYTITVTDQRGRTATSTGNILVYPYAVPTIVVSECYRSDSSGNADDSSRRIAMTATGGCSSLGGQNAVTITAAAGGNTFSLTSGTRYITGELFNPDASLSVAFTVTDIMGNTATYTATIPTRAWAMQFYDGGAGVSFGKACEYQNTMHIPSNWVFRIGSTTLSEAQLIALLNLLS